MTKLLLSLAAAAGLSALATVAASEDEMPAEPMAEAPMSEDEKAARHLMENGVSESAANAIVATRREAMERMIVRKGAGAPVGDSLVLKAGMTAQFEGGFVDNDDRLANTDERRNAGFVNGRA